MQKNDILIILESPTKAALVKDVLSEEGVRAETFSTNGSISEVSYSDGVFRVAASPVKRNLVERLVEKSRGKDVYVATDFDREGELTALSLKKFLVPSCASIHRCRLLSMGRGDCASILENTESFNMSMACAAMLRRHFDITASRALFELSSPHPSGPFITGRVNAPLVEYVVEGKPYVKSFDVVPPRTGDVLADAADAGTDIESAMRGLQEAYEKGALTYVRTDNGRISLSSLEEFARSIDFFGEIHHVSGENKFAQGAHECIRPLGSGTGAELSPRAKNAVGHVGRILASSMKGEKKIVSYDGVCEASLVRYMQDEGVARPSTYVSAVESLSFGPYARMGALGAGGRTLFPTERGMELVEFLRAECGLALYMTVPMERELSLLETGAKSLSKTAASLCALLDEVTGRENSLFDCEKLSFEI